MKASFEVLGTMFSITVWDPISEESFAEQVYRARMHAEGFDALYSRFKPASLVTTLSTQKGIFEVPHDLVAMLRLYERLGDATGGAINPAVGFALEDTGYDTAYTLRAKENIRPVPCLADALKILDDIHIELMQPVLLDLGALGKGYLVDRIHDDLRCAGLKHFLVDGSGDVRYASPDQEPIVCGLEHPHDPQQVIGTLSLTGGSLCASATNRRRWGDRNHYFHPDTGESPGDIIATWVYAPEAALADGLSSALFFVPPEELYAFTFEYCIINAQMERKNSAGFAAEFFA
jgi:FAD:protein FMN transferase